MYYVKANNKGSYPKPKRDYIFVLTALRGSSRLTEKKVFLFATPYI